MRRREFITLFGGAAAAWPMAARAQQSGGMRRIGVLMGIAQDAEGKRRFQAFQKGLNESGWTDHTLRIEDRWGSGESEQTREAAAELVSLRPEVILVQGARALTALMRETSTIPIVFVATNDPVGSGFAGSLARPGGNRTGFTVFELSIIGKLVEDLKEIAPRLERVALLFHRDNPNAAVYPKTLETVAALAGVEALAISVSDASDIERFMNEFAQKENGGLLFTPDNTITVHRKLIIELTTKHRLPAVFPYRYFVTDGGLMSYGVDQADLYRRAASYVDRILKGEKPTDLPIQTPTKYELVLNLKTARALGLEPSAKLLALADEVIE